MGTCCSITEEGNPYQSVSPDIFVVRGITKRPRRTYKLWEEGKPPEFILEVTSRSTRWEDMATKMGLCRVLGVREYFLYDPLGEYLQPPLQGYRLENGSYWPIVPGTKGELRSEVLDLALSLAGDRLRLFDPEHQRWLLTPAELEEARRQAEARAAALEAEVRRLRALLEQQRG